MANCFYTVSTTVYLVRRTFTLRKAPTHGYSGVSWNIADSANKVLLFFLAPLSCKQRPESKRKIIICTVFDSACAQISPFCSRLYWDHPHIIYSWWVHPLKQLILILTISAALLVVRCRMVCSAWSSRDWSSSISLLIWSMAASLAARAASKSAWGGGGGGIWVEEEYR